MRREHNFTAHDDRGFTALDGKPLIHRHLSTSSGGVIQITLFGTGIAPDMTVSGEQGPQVLGSGGGHSATGSPLVALGVVTYIIHYPS